MNGDTFLTTLFTLAQTGVPCLLATQPHTNFVQGGMDNEGALAQCVDKIAAT